MLLVERKSAGSYKLFGAFSFFFFFFLFFSFFFFSLIPLFNQNVSGGLGGYSSLFYCQENMNRDRNAGGNINFRKEIRVGNSMNRSVHYFCRLNESVCGYLKEELRHKAIKCRVIQKCSECSKKMIRKLVRKIVPKMVQ